MDSKTDKLTAVLDDPALDAYRIEVKAGEVLFYEGEDSRDLYVLLEGQVEVQKGSVTVARFGKKGLMLGEMSYLLGSGRTATVKVLTKATLIRIPEPEIESVLARFPVLGFANSVALAERLSETTGAYIGFKEFSDQFPEAILITNRDGEVVTWNQAAQKLTGLGWDEFHGKSATALFPDFARFDDLVEHVRGGAADETRVLQMAHPQKGPVPVSVTHTVLKNEIGGFSGILLTLRDAAVEVGLERRYRNARTVAVAAVSLLVVALAALMLLFPRLFGAGVSLQPSQARLLDILKNDRHWISEKLPATGEKPGQVLEAFFRKGQGVDAPYDGIFLLDEDKKAVTAVCPEKPDHGESLVGHSFSGIAFNEVPGSVHRVLVMYQIDPDNPQGRKLLGLAFPINGVKPEAAQWLLFRLDPERLARKYLADESTLMLFSFD